MTRRPAHFGQGELLSQVQEVVLPASTIAQMCRKDRPGHGYDLCFDLITSIERTLATRTKGKRWENAPDQKSG